MSDMQPHQPDSPPNIHVDGSGHTLIFGSVGKQSTSVAQTFYGKYLASHGALYWLIHLLVALLAAALWEGRHWLFQLFK